MSAREDLIRILSGGHGSQYAAIGLVADQILDAYANELADRIDAELPERVEKLTGDWAEIRTIRTAREAADLIRPKGTGR